MSECPHYLSVEPEFRYHAPLGPKGIDCCVNCYVAISPPNDISVFMTLNRAFTEQRMHDHKEAEWLLAEKDEAINDLRDTVEILEADDLT